MASQVKLSRPVISQVRIWQRRTNPSAARCGRRLAVACLSVPQAREISIEVSGRGCWRSQVNSRDFSLSRRPLAVNSAAAMRELSGSLRAASAARSVTGVRGLGRTARSRRLS